MSDSKRYSTLVNNTILFAISNFGSKIISLIIQPYLSYALASPDVMGVTSLMQSVANLLIPVVRSRAWRLWPVLSVSTHLCLWLRCSATLPTCVPSPRAVASMSWSRLTTSRCPRTLLTRSLLVVPRADR